MLREVNAVLERSGSGIVHSVRRPRGLNQKGSWKADEWRTFTLTTSLIALHDVLPDDILKGWWMFCQIYDISMRPRLTAGDMGRLSSLCFAFFNHFSSRYYKRLDSRLHLMRYTIHLLLHIPISTTLCGPLVCLSQFSTERFIGLVKESINAKYLFAESAVQRWIFQQAVYLCERNGWNIDTASLRTDSNVNFTDTRSKYSNLGSCEGFSLKGPCHVLHIGDVTSVLYFPLRTRLIRFYMSELYISQNVAEGLVAATKKVLIWDRLIIRRPNE